MEQANRNDELTGSAKKPTNWYSGWRLLATSAATVLAVKLIGILGTFIAGLVFYWLRPKRGTGQAAIAAGVTGVLVAVVYSAALLPALYPQQAQPAASPPPAAAHVPHANEDGPWKKYQQQ